MVFGRRIKTRFVRSKTMFVACDTRADLDHFFLVVYHMPEQCTATTRQGHRCKRQAREGTERCGAHTQIGQCPVCLDEIGRQSRTLECGHTFHVRCLERWKRVSRTCPLCRVPFDQPTYKIRVSIQRTQDSQVYSHVYQTSNVSALTSAFGFDPFMDPRFVTDIMFDIANDETITQVFQELGLRIPTGVL